jgi:hypothetical protein
VSAGSLVHVGQAGTCPGIKEEEEEERINPTGVT